MNTLYGTAGQDSGLTFYVKNDFGNMLEKGEHPSCCYGRSINFDINMDVFEVVVVHVVVVVLLLLLVVVVEIVGIVHVVVVNGDNVVELLLSLFNKAQGNDHHCAG